jgi:hypothetical protein
MKYKIKSRKMDCTVTFSRPGTGYVYIDFGGRPGTLGLQICYGGHLLGNTITYRGDDEAGFEKLCRNWWKQYIGRF